MRSLHTDVPLGSDRSSGSAVRFPVITTLLMLVAATGSRPFSLLLVRSGALCLRSSASFESRAACGRNFPDRSCRCRLLRRSPRPRRGAEDLVPVRSADSEAARLVLEMVAHVALAQHPAQPSVRGEVM